MMIDGDFLVIEWVKVKIHEPESEQQTSPNSCTVTMDDFRVCQRQQSFDFDEIDHFSTFNQLGCTKECSTFQ